MDNKGQMSVEYLLIVLVVILVLAIVTVPLISNSIDASNDVSHSSDAKVAATTIANAADTVYANGPHSKRTVNLYIPSNVSKIEFEGKEVCIPVTLSNGTKNITANTQYGFTNENPLYVTKGWYEAVVSCEEGSVEDGPKINVTLTQI